MHTNVELKRILASAICNIKWVPNLKDLPSLAFTSIKRFKDRQHHVCIGTCLREVETETLVPEATGKDESVVGCGDETGVSGCQSLVKVVPKSSPLQACVQHCHQK